MSPHSSRGSLNGSFKSIDGTLINFIEDDKFAISAIIFCCKNSFERFAYLSSDSVFDDKSLYFGEFNSVFSMDLIGVVFSDIASSIGCSSLNFLFFPLYFIILIQIVFGN